MMPSDWPFFAALAFVLLLLVIAALHDYRADRARQRGELGGLGMRLTVRGEIPTCIALPTAHRRGWRA